MGKLDFRGAIGSAVQGLLNIGSTAIANNTQRKMQREQNAFNAQQADLNRQFQSREAEIARDWQEQQYNEYSSPSAMVRQYKEAGLNPAMMYGSNLQSSTGSTSAPSGSTASGSTPSAFAADLTGIASAFLGLAKLKQDINESKSREAANYSSAAKSSSDISVNKQNIQESQARISKLISETKNEDEKRGLIVAQRMLTNIESQLKTSQTEQLSYQILREKWEKEFKDTYGMYPAENAYQAVQRVMDILFEKSGIKDLPLFGKIFK